MARRSKELRVPALEVKQGAGQVLYSFAIDGKRLGEIATVSRVRRRDSHSILGYQRPEVISHISEIRSYLESESPMIPNALVVAFDGSVCFIPGTEPSDTGSCSRQGTLTIPLRTGRPDHCKPGWIVDGQQRAAAIRDAKIDSFPICVVGFIARDEKEQREQFILVNSTKPLPKGLIYELLPTTDVKLPSLLQRRRFPALLMSRLNNDDSSPLNGLIRTPTAKDGVVKDNSILRMLENSLSDGILYRFRDAGTGEGDVDRMLRVLCDFWRAVSDVFPDAWGLPARRSRLMHGAGIASLGFLMDAISDRHRRNGVPTREQYASDLRPLEDVCRWTDGYWDFGPGQQRKWNEVQNTSKDIRLLSNYLLVQYKALVWNAGKKQGIRDSRG